MRAVHLLSLAVLVACTTKEEPAGPDTEPGTTDTGTPIIPAITLAPTPGSSVCAPAEPLFQGTSTLVATTLSGELTLNGLTQAVEFRVDADGSFGLSPNDVESFFDVCVGQTTPTCDLSVHLLVDIDTEVLTVTTTLELTNDIVLLFLDEDGDGYGADVGTPGCADDAGTLALLEGDCDDTDPLLNPGAQEQCDDIDHDCDGVNDNDIVYTDWYRDLDGDGFGESPAVESTCDGPSDLSLVDNQDDCNDDNPAVYEGATEVCDGVDNDCNGYQDDGDPDGVTGADPYWVDADRDDAFTDEPVYLCIAPSGAHVTTAPVTDIDCDDSDNQMHPFDYDGDGASPCEGDCAENNEGQNLRDDDGDGFSSCDGDCRDLPSDPAATSTYPGAPEIPGDFIDGDCNGFDDCFADLDNDNSAPENAAIVIDASESNPPNCDIVDFVARAPLEFDCDDNDPAINPGAYDIPGDLIDADCDGIWRCYYDEDSDGFSIDAYFTAYAACGTLGTQTTAALTEIDCDSRDASIYPGAPELLCDEIVQDCRRTDDASLARIQSGPSVLYDGSPSKQLSLALDDAADGDTLSLCPLIFDGDGWSTTADLIIEGNGASLNGGYIISPAVACPDDAKTLFDVDGATVTLRNLTLTESCQSPVNGDFGGGLSARNNAQVTLEDVTFYRNTAVYGAAIAALDTSTVVWNGGSSDFAYATLGATFWVDENASVTVQGTPGTRDMTFDNSYADEGGLGYVAGTFVGSDMTVETAYGFQRGGVFFVEGQVDLQGVDIVNGKTSSFDGEGNSFYILGDVSFVDGSIDSEVTNFASFVVEDPGTLYINGVIDAIGVIDNIECRSAVPFPLTYSSDDVTTCTGQDCVP